MGVRAGFLVGLLLLGCQGASGAPRARTSAEFAPVEQPLRLEKIRFFEVGVSYFERAGTAHGARPALLVPEPHVEDALASLIVLSGAPAGAPRVEFTSAGAAERERERVSLPGDRQHIEYQNLLASLEGEEIEFTAPSGRSEGRLVKVGLAPPVPLANPDSDEPQFDARTMDDLYLLIAGLDGVQRLRASAAAPIRVKDPARRALLDRAVKSAWAGNQPPRVSLDFSGARAPLRIGYVADTTPFVPSYRLALPATGAEAALSASALVCNDTDESWTNVATTFESLRPGPFGASLRAPRKARPSAPPGSFEYPARETVTVPAHGSTLVPFLNTRVESRERVWFSAPGTPGRRAVRFENKTAQTFPQGDITIFAAHGFAGKGTLRRLLPGSSGLVDFAEELDVSLELTSSATQTEALEATFDGFELKVRTRESLSRAYSVENRKARPVSVEVGPERREPVRLLGFDAVAGEGNERRGVLEVAGREQATRAVMIQTEAMSTTTVEDVLEEPLRAFAESTALSGRVRAALRTAAALAARMEKNRDLAAELEQRASDVRSAAEGARGDLSQLKDNSAAAAPLVTRLVALEREHERLLERSRGLVAENLKLVESVRRELGALPKHEKAG